MRFKLKAIEMTTDVQFFKGKTRLVFGSGEFVGYSGEYIGNGVVLIQKKSEDGEVEKEWVLSPTVWKMCEPIPGQQTKAVEDKPGFVKQK